MIHVMAVVGLGGPAMAAPVVGEHAEAFAEEEQHLRVPIIGRQRPAVAKHDGLPLSPVLIVNLRAVFGSDSAHILEIGTVFICMDLKSGPARSAARLMNVVVWVGRAANYAAKLMLYPRIRHNFSNRRGVQYDVESSEVQRQRSEPMWKERRGCLRAMRRVTYRVFGCRSARRSLLQRDESVRQ